MGKLHVLLSVLTLLALLSETGGRCTSSDKVIRRKRKALAKCLKQGYQSSLDGCISGNANGQQKSNQAKRCTKVDKLLASCDVSCVKKAEGRYGPFGEWSACSVACGTGVQSRTRECNIPADSGIGRDCVGKAHEVRACNGDTCPCSVDGGCGPPGEWSACTAECGGISGTRYRTRNCNNPSPKEGGSNCPGVATEIQACSYTNACQKICTQQYIGCWRDNKVRAITGGVRLNGDVEQCRAYTQSRGYQVFAVQYHSECFTSPDAHNTFSKYGRANDCVNGKGGDWANDVYQINCVKV